MLHIPVFQRWRRNKQQLGCCDDKETSVSDFGSAVHCGHLGFCFQHLKYQNRRRPESSHIFVWHVQMLVCIRDVFHWLHIFKSLLLSYFTVCFKMEGCFRKIILGLWLLPKIILSFRGEVVKNDRLRCLLCLAWHSRPAPLTQLGVCCQACSYKHVLQVLLQRPQRHFFFIYVKFYSLEDVRQCFSCIIYAFGHVGSSLQHSGPSFYHVGSFVAALWL